MFHLTISCDRFIWWFFNLGCFIWWFHVTVHVSDSSFMFNCFVPVWHNDWFCDVFIFISCFIFYRVHVTNRDNVSDGFMFNCSVPVWHNDSSWDSFIVYRFSCGGVSFLTLRLTVSSWYGARCYDLTNFFVGFHFWRSSDGFILVHALLSDVFCRRFFIFNGRLTLSSWYVLYLVLWSDDYFRRFSFSGGWRRPRAGVGG